MATATIYANTFLTYTNPSQSNGMWTGVSGLYAGHWIDPYANFGDYVGNAGFAVQGQIPAGTTITNATLNITPESTIGSVSSVSVYANTAGIGQNDFVPDPGTFMGTLSAGATYTGAVSTTVISEWNAGTRSNFGVALYGPGSGSNFVVFEDATNTDLTRAYLSITYFYAPGAPGAITAPATGATVSGTTTLTWGAASDTDTTSNLLVYQIDLSTNSGSNWTTIISATAAGVTTTSYDFGATSPTATARLRIRARDPQGLYGPYTTGGDFTIAKPSHQMII